MTTRKSLILTGLMAVALAGCQGSGRFDSFGSGRPQTAAPVRPAPLQPAPTAAVTSSPLPPIGSPTTAAPSGGLPPIGSTLPLEGPDVSDGRPTRPPTAQPIDPPPVRTPEPTQPAVTAPQVAARPEPQVSDRPTRSSVTGNWTAREAAGGSCRVTLSSVPTLDLYKASTSGCQSRELRGVNAWELRGDEVYLYEAGGGVAARLKASGRNFEGSASRTGAPVTLSK